MAQEEGWRGKGYFFLDWKWRNQNNCLLRQDNGNRSNQESKFDFLATRQQLVKIDEGA